MRELWRSSGNRCHSSAKVRLATLARRQSGRVSAAQLAAIGVDGDQVRSWQRQGLLHRVLPRVYAVGHVARSQEADLSAALLYAGPGAKLDALTEAWWLGVYGAERPPATISVATPRRCRGITGLAVHARRPAQRLWWARGDGHRAPRATPRTEAQRRDRGALAARGPEMPVAPLTELALALAHSEDISHDDLRFFLANLDYRGWLDAPALNAACGRGARGSTALTKALKHHLPMLARTKSRLERKLVLLCEREDVPPPEMNVFVHGILVDAFWAEQGLVVELDGEANHGRRGQVKTDRSKELTIRSHGLAHRRYGEDDIDERPLEVVADILHAFAAHA